MINWHKAVLVLCGCILILILICHGCFREKSEWQVKPVPLSTRWAEKVSPLNVRPEYPRPQMVRREWLNLNGLWDLDLPQPGDTLSDRIAWNHKILVPFPVESALSGVGEKAPAIWYRTRFRIPEKWHSKNILLHFGAVDWEAEVYLNGRKIGTHRGGYDPFSFDISPYLVPSDQQELIVRVDDPMEQAGYARGKQVSQPGGIFYTSTTGIWQTVWLEPVPSAYIKNFRLLADFRSKSVSVQVEINDPDQVDLIGIFARQGEKILGRVEGKPGADLVLKVPQAELWEPDNPVLYDLEIELLQNNRVADKIDSYFGLREIGIGRDEQGINRIMLNGKFRFQLGLLDQGFWPDGLYAAPSDEALRYDIEQARKLGFNLLRKHVKQEPQRWYYWCDKLGMLVWQDMPSVHPGDLETNGNDASKNQFETELKNMIRELYNHPSIVMWVVFNEGWGQYDTGRLTQLVKELDPSRLVNAASGWTDMNTGDVVDIHAYPGPAAAAPEETRAAVLGEFGGLGLPVPGHTWTSEHWGYQNMADYRDLRDRYEKLLDQVWKLKDQNGLSAAVYTQLTDVETETNGLITYDRAVLKLKEHEAVIFNRDEMISPPTISPSGSIFLDEMDITLGNRKGEPIRYTLDGSDPATSGTVYRVPMKIDTTVTVKARSLGKKGQTSGMVEAKFEKTTLLPAMVADTPLSSGWKYFYYEGDWDSLPAFDNLEWIKAGVSSNVDLRDRSRDDFFGLKFEGFIKISRDGVYAFYTRSDDGSRLIIADRPVVENDGLHGLQEKRGQIALQKGLHPVILIFFEKSGDQGLEVLYEGPGIGKQQLPADILFH